MKTPENPHADAFVSFSKYTKNHELTVLKDDGLYRHLRMAEPGTRAWSWDIITWPGYLTIVGDVANGYTFTREEDMLAFFSVPEAQHSSFSDGAPQLDLRYCAEKLIGTPEGSITEYSKKVFLSLVDNRLGELLEDNTVDPEDAELFDDAPDPDAMTEEKAAAARRDAEFNSHSAEAAHDWMQRHPEIMGEDSWEYSLDTFGFQFVLAMLCVDETVRRFRNLGTSSQGAIDAARAA